MGPSGVGKGSIAAALIARTSGLWLSRSWTTRPRRQGEDANAYHFVDDEAFSRRDESDGFYESARVFDHRYGTPVPHPPEGHDVVLEIDVQGAAQVRARRPDAIVVLILAPSRQAQGERLRGRGESEETVARRLGGADREEEAGRTLADHVVVNDDLSRATDEVAAIVEDHRLMRDQSPPA